MLTTGPAAPPVSFAGNNRYASHPGLDFFSKEALARAEQQFSGGEQGILDEIGFRTLHQAYADRFFPGTSVLHTRLRYALFVPWIYEQAGRERGQTFARRVAGLESWLTKRLKASEPTGVIGSRIHPRAAIQSASMSFWGALGAWGILRPQPDGSFPTRSAVHRRIHVAGAAHRSRDDDENPLEEEHALFVALPEVPNDWKDEAKPLTFTLRNNESAFLRQRWTALRRPDGQPALLAQIAAQHANVSGEEQPWSPAILDLADAADRAALTRAGQVSALAAIGRAVYAALVETLRDEADGQPTSRECRDRCAGVVAEYRARADRLNLAALSADLPPSRASDLVLRVLAETQAWLRGGTCDMRKLLDCYRTAEEARKWPRVRLSAIKAARDRRLVWKASDTPAEPLHYRWAQVRTLLRDLHPTPT